MGSGFSIHQRPHWPVVVATRTMPSCSESENWSRTVPFTRPEPVSVVPGLLMSKVCRLVDSSRPSLPQNHHPAKEGSATMSTSSEA